MSIIGAVFATSNNEVGQECDIYFTKQIPRVNSLKSSGWKIHTRSARCGTSHRTRQQFSSSHFHLIWRSLFADMNTISSFLMVKCTDTTLRSLFS